MCRFPESDAIVLIAGGIGITPLLSILKHVGSEEPSKPTLLLCSVRSLQDRFFKDKVEEVANNNPNIRVVWTVTDKHEVLRESEELHRGRIDLQMLKKLKVSVKSVCFVCGPPLMVQDVVQHLKVLGVENIQFERW
jgi:ferredoxin-NADP reductase